MDAKDYESITLTLPQLEYSDAALEARINALLVKNKNTTALYGGLGIKNLPITIGDVVSLWYRSYIIDSNGREVETDSNLASATPVTLEVGAGNFALGFEEGFLGLVPNEHTAFTPITEGTVGEGDVVYLSFECLAIDPSDDRVATAERVDLSLDYIDELYGAGFKELILGKEIGEMIIPENGSQTFAVEGGSNVYRALKVEYVTRCESDPVVISFEYPADYDAEELRGVKTYFEIYLDSAVMYDTPEYNDAFVTEKLGYTAESLSAYSGDTLAAKHREKVKAEVKADIKETNRVLVLNALKKYINSIGTLVDGYPEDAVNAVVDAQYAAAERYYENYAASEGFSSIDEAAVKYFGLKTGADWMQYIERAAETEVKNKLVFYYIILMEGYVPTEEEIRVEMDNQIDAEVEYQMNKYADSFKDFTAEEYETQRQMIRDQIKSWYGESMLREVAIQNYGMNCLYENNVTVVAQ